MPKEDSHSEIRPPGDRQPRHQAVAAMADAVGPSTSSARSRLILDCPGSVLTSGIGKAGHIARKLSATFSSTGTPSHFLDPAEAVHGDLGSVRAGRPGPHPFRQRRER